MEDFLKIIIECKEEDLEQIIKERIFVLESAISTNNKTIIPNEQPQDYGSYYIGFIKNDVKIYFSMDFMPNACYTLGNYDYIFTFFKNIKRLNINDKSSAIKYLSNFADEYFGRYNGVDQREEFLMRYKGNATIDCLKNKGLAACSERSAITNNLLEMMGLKSIYVTGTVEGEQHAFNIMIDGGNRYFVLDTTHNCGLYDENNNLIGTSTYYYPLGEMSEKTNSFLTNETQLNLPNMIAIKLSDGTIKFKKNGQIKSYTIEPIKLNEEIVMKH